ncbi:MAG: hypothetical protein RMJ67_07485 [Elusimicrobiota bacterium]|nr:hypothetical protein [Endomicrobiia bacterium]MDW8166333.1 hypothetical protein [Elusimicrobiota bacterium]
MTLYTLSSSFELLDLIFNYSKGVFKKWFIKNFVKAEKYSLSWCKNCNLIFSYSVEDPSNMYYENEYYKINWMLKNQLLRWPHKMFFIDFCQIFPSCKSSLNKKLLDIDCRMGLFINYAQKYIVWIQQG